MSEILYNTKCREGKGINPPTAVKRWLAQQERKVMKMSKTFWVDFSGYCQIEAETEEEAAKNFWALVHEDRPFPHNIYEIDDIEEKTE